MTPKKKKKVLKLYEFRWASNDVTDKDNLPPPCRYRSCWMLVRCLSWQCPSTKRYGPAQGRTLASSWEDFIAGARRCLSALPVAPPLLSFHPQKCVSTNVCQHVCVCAHIIWPICHNHQAQIKMQLLGAHFEWNEVRGDDTWWGLISREKAKETLNIPLDLDQPACEAVCVCVSRQRCETLCRVRQNFPR